MSDLSWEKISVYLAGKIPSQEFNRWVLPLRVNCKIVEAGSIKTNRQGPKGEDVFSVSIQAGNKYKMEWVRKHYGEYILEAIADACHSEDLVPKVQYSCGEETKNNNRNETRGWIDLSKATSSSSLVRYKNKISSYPNFSNFIEGNVNPVAKKIAMSIADQNKRGGNFFFFYGGSGLGKTHLLQAVAKEFVKNKSSVIYVRAEVFVRSMYHHLTHKSMEKFKDIYRQVDVLLIDDIQILKKKPKAQEEFFHTLDARLSEEKIVVLSADVPPPQMNYFADALQSRLASSPAVRLDRLNKKTCLAIIHQKCCESRIRLADDCIEYIAERADKSVREIEGALKLVSFYMDVHKRSADLPMMRQIFSNLRTVKMREVTPDEIRQIVEKHYQLPSGELKKSGRTQTSVLARRMAMYLCRELTSRSTTEIGAVFNRKHSAVVQAVNYINGGIQKKDDIKCLYEAIKKEILLQ